VKFYRDYNQIINLKIIQVFSKDTNTSNYDYLIKMSIYLFTEDEIEKLDNQTKELTDKYNALQGQSIEDIWLSECDELVKFL